MTELENEILGLRSNGLIASDISEELKLDVRIIQDVLNKYLDKQGKPLPPAPVGNNKILNKFESEKVLGGIKEIAFDGTKEETRLKALIWLRDEDTGRNAARAKMRDAGPGNTFILQINEQLRKIRQIQDEVLEDELIDV